MPDITHISENDTTMHINQEKNVLTDPKESLHEPPALTKICGCDCSCRWDCTYVAEALYFLFTVGLAMNVPSIRLYLYDGSCLEIANQSVCSDLVSHPDIGDQVQRNAANYLIYYKLLDNVPAVLLGLFCGSWSDKIGRKLPVLLSCVGSILFSVILIISVTPGLPIIPFVFAAALVRGCFGRQVIIEMALHSYISDICSKEDRTKRLGRLLAMEYLGFALGSFITGQWLELENKDHGYLGTYTMVAGINCLCFIIAILGMKKTIPMQENTSNANPLKWSNLVDSMTFAVTGRRRWYFALMYVGIFLNYGLRSGEKDVLLLFVESEPLYWDGSTYAYLVSATYISVGVGVLIALPLCIQYLRWNDISILIIGIFSSVVRTTVLTFSTNTWMAFTGTVLGFVGGYLVAAAKSIISKTVSEDEMGKAFGLVCSGQAVFELLGSLVLLPLYTWTAPFYRGSVFGITSVVFVLFLIYICIIACDMHKEYSIDHLDENKEIVNTEENISDYGTSKSELMIVE